MREREKDVDAQTVLTIEERERAHRCYCAQCLERGVETCKDAGDASKGKRERNTCLDTNMQR